MGGGGFNFSPFIEAEAEVGVVEKTFPDFGLLLFIDEEIFMVPEAFWEGDVDWGGNM